MFGLFNSRDKDTRALIVDIGSGSVGASIVDLVHDDRPVVHRTARTEMRLREDIHFKDFYLAMLEALRTTLELLKKGDANKTVPIGSVKHVHLTFASPWYSAEARTIQYRQKTSFRFSRSFLKKLLAEDLEHFRAEFDAHKQVEDDDTLLLLDQAVIDVRLNGYSTEQIEADSVHEAEATVFVSLMSEKVRDAVKKVVGEVCGTSRYTLQSFPMVLYTAVRDMMVIGDDFVLVDIGGEVTDIVFVHDSVPERTYSIPLGHNTIVRHVAGVLGTSLLQGRSALDMLAKGTLDTEAAEHMKVAIGEVMAKFRGALGEIVSEQAREFMLPERVFLTIDTAPVEWLYAHLGSRTLGRMTIDSYTTQPIMLTDTLLAGYVEHIRGIRRDTFLSLEAIFLQKILYLKDDE